MDTAAECAKDARRMYKLPVDDRYCTTGVDADIIFYPVMSQYTENVAGWGIDAAQDEHGRPLIIAMGWSPPTGLKAYLDLEARSSGSSSANVYPPDPASLHQEWNDYAAKVSAAV